MALTPAENMLYCATRIKTYCDDTPLQVGTGFFYTVTLDDGRLSTLLVSNRHVFEGCNRIDLSLHMRSRDKPAEPSGKAHSVRLDLSGSPIGHPDPNVDLAVLSITYLHGLEVRGIGMPFINSLDRRSVPSPADWAELDAVEDVSMVGCPNGLFDEFNNLPIVRRGVTASHPSKDYEGRKEFMVDLACFPGSSGSPIFQYSTGPSFDRKTGNWNIGQMRLSLLGILYAGPVFNSEGQVVLTRTASFSVSSMMHLGMAIKSTELLAFDAMVQQSGGQA